MANRRPLALDQTGPNYLRELPDLDALIVEKLSDRGGFAYLTAAYVASAVNGLTLTPGAAGTAGRLAASGAGTDLDLCLNPKGTGKVKGGASGSEIELVDLSSAQTLTTKTLTDATNVLGLSIGVGSVRQFVKNPSATTLVNLGFTADAVLVGTIASGDQSARPYLKCTTPASTDGDAGVESPTVDCVRGLWTPRLILPIRTGADVTSLRLWAGLTSADLKGSDSPTGSFVAVRASTSASDTNLKLVTSAGSTVTVVDTGVALAANTDYVIDLERRASDWRLIVNGVVRATATATLPAQSTFLGIKVQARTLNTTAKDVYVGSIGLGMK